MSLYCITDVREMIRSVPICASREMSASVIPSEKYSCAGSRDRFRSGRTASDESRGGAPPRVDVEMRCHSRKPIARSAAAAASGNRRLGRNREAGKPGAVTVSDEASVSANATSFADWKRRAGSFSRQRRTTRSSARGASGRVSVTEGGWSVRIRLIVSAGELPRNAR